MPSLKTKRLTLGYGETTVINNLDLSIPEGRITVLIGSNGSGKSTLLRSLARLLKPREGTVLLNGKNIASLSTKEVAKQMAILPQTPVAPEGLTVLQLVKQGRYPYQSWLKQWSEEDEQAVQKALAATNLTDLAERQVDSLSGGQRQRAWIAMSLAQDTDILLLDEPTTYLDLAHQIEILDLLYDLNRSEGRTIVMVLHDLNLACRYADYMIAVYRQGIFAQGEPEQIMSPGLVEKVFGLSCQVITDPLYGTPLCVPYGKGKKQRRRGHNEITAHA
ncbi:iron complex transport system ATP-binding protein [Caldalkalibacillus uzonensis]|uniref:Iron complex transport system ATP-binding protein n=1 Tax=Caldalkalibacillus uzonensis TaxID=353224 RepID=A0ABU0CSM9_9BACI|nr:ABC transporter ATP-binding protein [Caldalkalibacillus uzonensis]MDQ0338490.1 iron complex transport system ATP-binding protein [Caldalkalibacillus uzonensis]